MIATPDQIEITPPGCLDIIPSDESEALLATSDSEMRAVMFHAAISSLVRLISREDSEAGDVSILYAARPAALARFVAAATEHQVTIQRREPTGWEILHEGAARAWSP